MAKKKTPKTEPVVEEQESEPAEQPTPALTDAQIEGAMISWLKRHKYVIAAVLLTNGGNTLLTDTPVGELIGVFKHEEPVECPEPEPQQTVIPPEYLACCANIPTLVTSCRKWGPPTTSE